MNLDIDKHAQREDNVKRFEEESPASDKEGLEQTLSSTSGRNQPVNTLSLDFKHQN